MSQAQPIVITGGARRIGLALAQHFVTCGQPVIISYRTHYPVIGELEQAGVCCIAADFSTDEGVLNFARQIREQNPAGLRAIIHNASQWIAEGGASSDADVMTAMLQIHVRAPYLLNQTLASIVGSSETASGDIVHFTDYVVERGSDKHIAYAASKAALDNLTRSFARKLAPRIKVNAIAPSLIMFNPEDNASYRQNALDKSLMRIAPGEQEIIHLVDYLLSSQYATGRTFAVDGGRHLR
ncbi:dihydromonapterin reductase [Mangrovibacter phragmitis]|uniref:Dihydromonapterin reductase n=1 Tax=Mangrovibacter phragmitis TaxID=1691903 RepID=A0A1B7L7D4_9ENTR|nr:dihydromonapterin reductase [Mangrovibacter phragmitis]OAT78170.1 dihydromonapterin reductase [Mangrovibacter phragmitis]